MKLLLEFMACLPCAEAAIKEKTPVDKRGGRYNVSIPVTGPNGKSVDVLTAWIYDRVENGKSISMKPLISRRPTRNSIPPGASGDRKI
ncbi:MAG: hypothetical protein LBC94_03840 [Desulfovibrio sp.]|nr:hypothetical protein [Desulfovibrio sp.]